ncbi:uncharacterized protein LOC133294504 [Gastrolobium bilobum]|uniref:uncharacterized protein LOC133294504 n=1 Tax=Gastrolobium bilobum TaxID=150636 RepID=UPI002AB1CA29|nr:uncharacterized protein LOC133294504 [Gastrolobium bilobum]XP_061349171.1 uncharacterized protein LOC133294504 [Gastrolobium bilobum]
MEIIGGYGLAIDSTMKRKRTRVSRRPRANSDTLFQSYFDRLSLVEPFAKQADNENVRDTMVASDRLGTDNKLKKLKLKFGGVTHTIHAKSKTETGFDCGSFITNFSPCSDGPKPQDETDGIDAYLLDKRRGLGDKFLKPSRTESGSTAENHSQRGKTTGQSLNVNHEHVRKGKCIPKRCALDVGSSDEDNEDAELHFLETLNASKRVVNRHKDNRGSTEEHVICKVAESSQIDDLKDLLTPGSIKDGKKKLNSKKKYEDDDYVEEDPTSSDESLSERKKPKRKNVDLLVRGRQCARINRNCTVDSSKDALSGSDASIIDISDNRMKGKSSEMEQQLKKAEAAKRRKIQSEKAAREAEAAAIRKILGQESGRKKKEEKMNKRRDELAKEKSSKSFNLGSNTVRWTMGPKGTVVTFSEDIGLPSIFQTMPNSYPLPREKCAGQNCTNVYKYRDSKSKLPLCSLGCYRAIHEKIRPVVAC